MPRLPRASGGFLRVLTSDLLLRREWDSLGHGAFQAAPW